MTALSITSTCRSLPCPELRPSRTEVSAQHSARVFSVWNKRAGALGRRSSGDVHVDFFGGVPYADYTTTTGNLRLRTAHTRLDWSNHSLIAALDAPLYPRTNQRRTSAWGTALRLVGNLWIWVPQIESINRVHLGAGTLGFDFALLDPPPPAVLRSQGTGNPTRPSAANSRV